MLSESASPEMDGRNPERNNGLTKGCVHCNGLAVSTFHSELFPEVGTTEEKTCVHVSAAEN